MKASASDIISLISERRMHILITFAERWVNSNCYTYRYTQSKFSARNLCTPLDNIIATEGLRLCETIARF